MHVISNEVVNGDNEVDWRYDMLSNIVYEYTNEGAMLDRFHVTLLLNNELLSNRFLMVAKKRI